MDDNIATILRVCERARDEGKNITHEFIENTVDKIKYIIGGDYTDEYWSQVVFQVKSTIDIDIFDYGSFLVDDDAKRWLDHNRADFDWGFWKAYAESLKEDGRPSVVIKELDRITDEVLDASGDPRINDKGWKRRGLVMGNVQSGKTQNYLGLINKALDTGYKVIILLGGHLNELRVQTQERVDYGVIGKKSVHHQGNEKVGVRKKRADHLEVDTYTTTETDFNKKMSKSFRRTISENAAPLIFVIKKHAGVLNNLYDWIKDEHGLDPENKKLLNTPLMLIDDEADYASINTKKTKNEITAINNGIRKLLSLFRRTNYVAYTATPFANIFICPDTNDEVLGDDLFPEDYMVRIPIPDNYVGQQYFFLSDHADSEPTIKIDDHKTMIPMKAQKNTPIDQLSDSLKEAIRVFLLSTAVRASRGQSKSHSTMLVNVTHLTALQDKIDELIGDYLDEIKNAIDLTAGFNVSKAIENSSIVSQLQETFNQHYFSIPESFDQLFIMLKPCVFKIQNLAVHSSSANGKSLDYGAYKENGLSVIVTGGHKLSRGLTLEGLTVSYFARNSKMYDTLMQMCRWFGYRPGYDDLCKLFITSESLEWYTFIANSIDELYKELDRMARNKKRPKDFGLKVREYPGALIVTARQKMDSAESFTRTLDFSGQRVRRFQFKNDSDVNRENISKTSMFLKSIKDNFNQELTDKNKEKGYVYTDVGHNKILELISSLDLIDGEQTPNYLIEDYIKKLSHNKFPNFRVVVKQLSGKQSSPKWLSKLDKELPSEIRYPESGISKRIIASKRAYELSGNNEFVTYRKHEAGEPDDEKLLVPDLDTEEIKYNNDLIAIKGRDFPGLIIYTFAIAAKLGNAKPKDESYVIINDQPTVGFSLSFPLTENLKNISTKERLELLKKTKVSYQTNAIWRRNTDSGVIYEDEEDDLDE